MSGFDEFDDVDFDDIEMEDLDADLLAALDGDNHDEIDVGHQEPFDDIIDLDSDAFDEIKKAGPSKTTTPRQKQRTIMETYGIKSAPYIHVQHHQQAPSRQHQIDVDSVKNWVYPTNLKIRDYQKAIVHTALFTNTLVALPTGLGKTMIGNKNFLLIAAAVVIYNFYRWFPQGKVILN
jgi:hypothetical protein